MAGISRVYGTQYSQFNIPISGAKGMCGTFTAMALQVVGCKPLDGDFLDEITARSAQLHCLSAPIRSHQWAGVSDAVDTLQLGLDLDYVHPYAAYSEKCCEVVILCPPRVTGM